MSVRARDFVDATSVPLQLLSYSVLLDAMIMRYPQAWPNREELQ